jgi:hypothetical protein
MDRNDALFPFWGLVIAGALGWAAYLDGRYLIATGPEALSVGQVGLVAFGLAFGVYGLTGLFSVWLEGTEPRPSRRLPDPGRGALAAGVTLALVLVAVSGLFVRDTLRSLETERIHSAREGFLFGAMALLSALLLVVYKKYAVGEEVITEDEHSEVPW